MRIYNTVGYLSTSLDRPLLYKLLKTWGANVTTKTKHNELKRVYQSTMPESLTREVDFNDLDRWFRQ